VADPGQDEDLAEGGFRCPECGSHRVRRSAPRTPVERLVRAVSPFHRYKCRDCEHRGWHLGRVPSRHHEHDSVPPGGRPPEKRDIEAAQQRRRNLVGSLVLATALGVATGLYVQSCQQRSQVATPAP